MLLMWRRHTRLKNVPSYRAQHLSGSSATEPWGHDNKGNFFNNDRVQGRRLRPQREAPLYGYNAERLGGRELGKRRVNEF